VFRAELEAAADRSSQALLAHHLGRMFGRQQDFAAAAREELAATNLAAGFAAPLEALWAIALRGRSRKNTETLLGRLAQIARAPAERERAGLPLAAQYLDEGRTSDARRVLEACLEGAPQCLAGWVLLEELGHRELDLALVRRALTGRAAAAGSDEIESHFYERAARVALETGDLEEADALLDQALVTYPRWETLQRRERMLTKAGLSDRAAMAALASLDRWQAQHEGAPSEGDRLPPLMRSSEAAHAIRLRAALSWARAGDLPRALEQARQVAEAEGAGLFEQAFYLTLSERSAATDDAAQALGRALERASSSDAGSEAAVALWRWLTFERKAAEVDPPVADVLRDSTGYLGILLEQAERRGNAAALPELVERIASLTPRGVRADGSISDEASGHSDGATSRHTTPTARASLLMSATWLALATAQTDAARRLLEQARTEGTTEDLHVAIELGLSRHARDSAGELAALERLTLLAGDSPGREFFAWLAFRRALVSGSEDPSANAQSLRRVLGTLVRGSEQSAPIQLAAWLWGQGDDRTPGDESVFVSAEMMRAAGIAQLLLEQSEAGRSSGKTAAALRSAPEDVLLTALALRAAEDGDGSLAERVALLARFAELGEAPELNQALRLRALFLLFSERGAVALDAAALASDAAPALLRALSHERELDPLWPWLLRGRSTPVPPAIERTLSLLAQSEPWLELEAALRQLATWATEPTSPIAVDWSPSPQSAATRLLQALVAVATGDTATLDSLADLPQLTDRVLGGLLLGAASHTGAPSDRLAAARQFHQLAGGADALLAYAVTARLAGRPDEEARVARALAEELGAPELLAAAEARSRSPLDGDRARRMLGLAEGQGPRVQAAIAWQLCETAGSAAGSELRGQALELLADSIPGEVDGPLARLMAGFHALVAGDDERAIRLLGPLTEVLPEDSAVHLGLCAAALRLGRADIEAASSAELARREADPARAAELWERAGVLLQDRLGQPEQAEAAFQSAMGRVPGSPLAFVRLYQLAHAKRDRPRMVELIDARLESPTDEQQRVSLLWEKARHSRHLGRRGVACRALEELLDLSKDHLPALALLAELHLLDQRAERAAPLLRRIAVHPATPPAQRESAGLHAVDLFERLAMAREAMELLVVIEGAGVPVSRTRRRKARLAARVGRWDVAATTFRELAEEDDDIPTRVEAARMLLAVERDHLRESANLKDAARLVLRDAPTDPDAAAIVVRENFHPDERARLLLPAREATLAELRERPLDLPLISQMADFTEGTDNVREERAWLGALALTGRLSDQRAQRLEVLSAAARPLPTGSLGPADVEALAMPGQLGAMAELARIVVPKIAKATLPDLAGLGVSESMRQDPFGSSGPAPEISAFATALGLPEPQVFVGAVQAGTTLLLPGEAPTLILGSATTPLAPATRARIGYLLFAESLGVAPLLQLGLAEAKLWLKAVARLTARKLPERDPDEVEERARQLARLVGSDERAELVRLATEIEKSDRDLTDLALTTLTSAARAATLLHGDPSILRQLRELIPDAEQERTVMIGSVIQLLASPRIAALRTKLGLDIA